MKKITKYKIHIKDCWTCGKKFPVKVNYPDKKIVTNCFHSYINKHHFLGWTYSADLEQNFKITGVNYKNNFYKIIGFCGITREIYYFVWKLFHFSKLEYWECPECCKEGIQ